MFTSYCVWVGHNHPPYQVKAHADMALTSHGAPDLVSNRVYIRVYTYIYTIMHILITSAIYIHVATFVILPCLCPCWRLDMNRPLLYTCSRLAMQSHEVYIWWAVSFPARREPGIASKRMEALSQR